MSAQMSTLAPMPTLVPMPSAGAPLATLVSQTSEINCAQTEISASCQWSSPSAIDRSDPNSSMKCPNSKPVRVWRDRDKNNQNVELKREFKCMAVAAANSQASAATATCVPNNTVVDTCRKKWQKYQ